jgi:hypothetical protein
MSRTTFILAVIYFFTVEFAIITYSPHAKLLIPTATKTSTAKPQISKEEIIPDYSGEKIVYDVSMGAFKIGTSTFFHQELTKLGASDAYLVVFATKVARMNDIEKIWADTKNFLPLRVERDVRMWPKYEKIVEIYDQALHTLDVAKQSGSSNQTRRIAREGPIHNAILLPYQVRRIDPLDPGWSMKVTLPTQEFKITLVSIEDVEVPAGKFKAFYFESSPKRFEIWISADDKRIPVKIRGSSGLNYIMAMRSYSK